MLGNNLLQGKLIYLDAVRREDVKSLGQWFDDMEFLALLFPGVAFPQTEEDEMDWYERQRKGKDYVFAIRTREQNNLIGTTSLMRIDWRSRHSEFGIAIGDKNYWGKGFGTDATRRMLGYAFLELNLNRVELQVYDFNKRAIRSYEKVGFTHEGARRQAIFRDGQYHDIHVMSILRDEWLAEREVD